MVTPGALRPSLSWERSAMRSYTVAQARALHALAESRPTPGEYARERARILGGS
jgi:hypothetical protein